ncbi:cellulose biosynthesis protein BcsG [Zobellella sp. CGMCC 1.18722]|uniref:Cellulose biosynthesis protein BcsG n=1 Tax=Zobellella iuensis TaxID=2803811 RepID=A0ABS1QXT3_9GAMM|nr:cellulose biosynthesis protein BcsG [Zobellella iuensis]
MYFLLKLALFWLGYLNLQPLPNLVFAAVLLFPLGPRSLRILRNLLAIPVAAALLYQDTWFPPFTRLLNQPGVLDFSGLYLLELLERFINWQLCGLLLLIVVAYIYLRQWLRLTTFSLLGLAWLGIQPVLEMAQPVAVAQVRTEAPAPAPSAQANAEPDSSMLDGYLQDFYGRESERVVDFRGASEPVAPFDLVIINICSMAWDDLEAVGLRDNRLLQQMDVVFDHFNSATSYSGPAAIRLLRASCGQGAHDSLYQDAPAQCLLMDQLQSLGYSNEAVLNHNGQFDNFIGDIRAQGQLPLAALDTRGLQRSVIGFDSSPIWRDRDVLGGWWQRRLGREDARVAMFYNTTTLHDGNRTVLPDGGTRRGDYRELANRLIDDLTVFFEQLEHSQRRVVVVVVPEHGASLHGDRMQIAGMREIPSPSITHVPVGIRLFGMGVERGPAPQRVSEPSSYLALSAFIARLHDANADATLPVLLADLPVTPWVAENAGTVVLDYDGIPYVRLKENGIWLPYPARFK